MDITKGRVRTLKKGKLSKPLSGGTVYRESSGLIEIPIASVTPGDIAVVAVDDEVIQKTRNARGRCGCSDYMEAGGIAELRPILEVVIEK